MVLLKASTTRPLKTAYFFVACVKKAVTVHRVRLPFFSLVASNYTRFQSSRIILGTKGFTLVEVLVVIGLVTIILGATLFFDVNSYRGDAFRAERMNLVIALQTARANALNNINQSKHGVVINPSGYAGYVIFEGDSYSISDPVTRILIPASYVVTLASTSPQEVVFSQLSGDTGYSGKLVLVDNERHATTAIDINYEGKIGW